MIGIGLDAVEIERFRRSLERTPSMVTRLFTEGEQAYAAKASDGVERLAARFAVKEAVMKALGVGLGAFAFREVEVIRADGGTPSLVLYGGAAELARMRGVARWHLSITHTEHTAQAIVLAE